MEKYRLFGTNMPNKRIWLLTPSLCFRRNWMQLKESKVLFHENRLLCILANVFHYFDGVFLKFDWNPYKFHRCIATFHVRVIFFSMDILLRKQKSIRITLNLKRNWSGAKSAAWCQNAETVDSYIDIKCHMTQMVNLLGLNEKKKQHHQCEYVVCVNCRSRANQETNNWEIPISFSLKESQCFACKIQPLKTVSISLFD